MPQETTKTKLLSLLAQDENYIFLGIERLAEKLGVSGVTVRHALKKPDFETYLVNRHKSTPPYWNECRPYTSADKKEYQLERRYAALKKRFHGFSELVLDLDFGKCLVFDNQIGYTVETLKAGLGKQHEANLFLLSRYKVVTTQTHEGTIISTDKSGFTFCSSRRSYKQAYKQFQSLKQWTGEHNETTR